MGKDWVYNMSSGESKSSKKRTKKRGSSSGEVDRNNNTSTISATSSGCMSAVFRLFDLNHYFNFPFSSSSGSNSTAAADHHPRPLQGVVAPRNSLELDDAFNFNVELAAALSSSSSVNNPHTLQLQMGGIQIKTRVLTDQDLSSSSESAYMSGSPAGTKTPTLVARLMGLDLLPENSSPRPSSSSSTSNLSSSKSNLHHLLQKKNKRGLPRNITNEANTGTRSLPETPRTSSSSARRSDVDQRLSLQINKENSQVSGHEFEFSKFLTAKINAAAGRQADENMSPGQHAKQIVKQFKESVSRRVGRDITNTVDNRSDQRRDEHVVLLKSKKPTPSHDQKDFCSPKLRLTDIKHKSMTSTHPPKLPASPLSPLMDNQCDSVTVPSRVKVESVSVVQEKRIQQDSNCKNVSNDQKYGSRLYMVPQTSDLIRNKQEESFVKSTSSRPRLRHLNIPDKKGKKSIPLTNVPTILTVKKDPSPPATRLPHQQEGQRQQHKSAESQMKNSSRNGPPCPSCLSQINMYKQKGCKQTVPHLVTPCTNSNATTGDQLYQYISKILERTGIHDLTAAVSITNWYSPSHPLDPSTFHHLKLSETSTLSQCGLVFGVVDEILAGILKPYLNLKPWNSWKRKIHACLEQKLIASQLANTLCQRIRSFPSADCRDLDDIHGLIGTDLSESWWERDAYEEEFGDGIAGDVQGDILDGLMHETLHILLVSVR